jgi:hypothetical protein
MTLTDIGTINKAEQIEKGDGRNDIQIDLQAKFGFGGCVKDHKRATISSKAVSDLSSK